jgi:hypothetical protein
MTTRTASGGHVLEKYGKFIVSDCSVGRKEFPATPRNVDRVSEQWVKADIEGTTGLELPDGVRHFGDIS